MVNRVKKAFNRMEKQIVAIKNLSPYELSKGFYQLGVGSNFLLGTGPGPTRMYGEQARKNVKQIGHEILDHLIIHEPTLEEAQRIKTRAVELGVDYIWALGSGKVGVSAKLASDKDNFLVRTSTAPTVDEFSTRYVSYVVDGIPYGKIVPPFKQLIVKELNYNAPFYLVHSGEGDLDAKLSAVLDWRLADERHTSAIPYNEEQARIFLAGPRSNLDFYRKLQQEGITKAPYQKHTIHVDELTDHLANSGQIMEANGSSIGASGPEHLMEHTLELYTPGRFLHGEWNGRFTIPSLYVQEKYFGLKHDFIDWQELRDIYKFKGYDLTNTVDPELKIQAFMYGKKIGERRGRNAFYSELEKRGISVSRNFAREVLSKTGLISMNYI